MHTAAAIVLGIYLGGAVLCLLPLIAAMGADILAALRFAFSWPIWVAGLIRDLFR